MAQANLRVLQTTWNAGMTDQNSLQRGMMTKPDTVVPGLIFLFGQYNNKYGLSFLTQGLGNTKVTSNDDQFDWNVIGKTDKAITIIKMITTGTNIGYGGSYFTIRLAEKWFYLGEILWGDSHTQFRIQEHPKPSPDGVYWDYTCVLVDASSPTLYLPATDYDPGKKLGRVGNAYEEYSKGGGSNSMTPFKLRNQLTILRASKDITAHTQMQVAVFEFSNPKTGKTTRFWLEWEMWLFWANWYKTVESMRWYSVYNARPDGTINIPGENGRPVRIGAGVMQQIEGGNSRTYTRMTTGIWDDMFADASYNMKAADNRKFTNFAGEWAMVEAHRAMETKSAAYTLVDSKYVTGSGQQLTLGGQYVTYKGLNGIESTWTMCDIFDNPDLHTKLHPVSGHPLESYTSAFLDTSTYNGKPNLLGVSRESGGINRGLMTWSVNGSITATGGTTGDNFQDSRGSDLDGRSVFILSQMGTLLQNSTSCGKLACDIA